MGCSQPQGELSDKERAAVFQQGIDARKVLLLSHLVEAASIMFREQFGDKWWYRHVRAADVRANVVVFVIRIDGARFFPYGLISSLAGPPRSQRAVAATVYRNTHVEGFDSCWVHIHACSLA